MRSPSQPIVKYSMETYGPVLPDVTLRTNATVEVLKGLNVDQWPQRLRGVHFGHLFVKCAQGRTVCRTAQVDQEYDYHILSPHIWLQILTVAHQKTTPVFYERLNCRQ